MSNRIKLLSDALANQIAAGEVVQRPGSAVKELMENALDAGASEIVLVLKDGGKSLISVIDNGSGMSPMDARMSFERHATSKLFRVEDLFNIRTMGFRGEALASIAAVAQVEMVTKRNEDEVATRILIEGSKIISQDVVQATVGTEIAVKNLFFNIPARRSFLKSDEVEKRHAYEEFIRIALSHPEIKFKLIYNDEMVYHLLPGTLKMRITGLFKSGIEKHLLEVEETTDTFRLNGFIGTPDYTRKKRGDQYLFVNGRFVKNNLLNHAVFSAYERMILPDTFPFFVMFLDVDPSTIDVNVHPTKQEIKFEDNNLIYTYIKATVKHTLSYNLVSPAIDFGKDPLMAKAWSDMQPATRNAGFSGAQTTTPSRENYRIPSDFNKDNKDRWRELYKNIEVESQGNIQPSQANIFRSAMNDNSEGNDEVAAPLEAVFSPFYFQLHKSFIICQVKSGLMIIDQQAAHHRILFERFINKSNEQTVRTQTVMFPETYHQNASSMETFRMLLPRLNDIGFDIEITGQTSYVVHGHPSFVEQYFDLQIWFDNIVAHVEVSGTIEIDLVSSLAETFADTAGVKAGNELQPREMQDLVDQLFACNEPAYNIKGHKCFSIMSLQQIENSLN